MTISVDTLFQIIGLLGTLMGVIWYISSILNDIKKDLAKGEQLNTIQDQKIISIEDILEKKVLIVEDKITVNYTQCRDGRVKVWEDLNALKIKVAAMESKLKD